MTTQAHSRGPAYLACAALAFGVVHLGYEHLNGGVQSHHLLNRSDQYEFFRIYVKKRQLDWMTPKQRAKLDALAVKWKERNAKPTPPPQ
jgi:hypothetical protein